LKELSIIATYSSYRYHMNDITEVKSLVLQIFAGCDRLSPQGLHFAQAPKITELAIRLDLLRLLLPYAQLIWQSMKSKSML